MSQELLNVAGDIHLFTPELSTITNVLNFSLNPDSVTSSSALMKEDFSYRLIDKRQQMIAS